MKQRILSKKEIKARTNFGKLCDKEDFHRKKWERARKNETRKYHYEKMRSYADHILRGMKLVSSLQYPSVFGTTDVLLRYDRENYVKQYKERIEKQKLEAKEKFESNYRIALWFYSESLTADYGTHQCDKCSRTYHHSPSEVYLGAKKEYSNQSCDDVR